MRVRTSLGATYLGNGRCQFNVWAPLTEKVEVHIAAPQERFVPLQRDSLGYHRAVIEEVRPGGLYLYRLDGLKERPDPASRFQPSDVHSASQVVEPYFPWEDDGWRGLPLHNYIVYELHVGAFTPEGTFEAIVHYLDELKELGITAIELMPVAQFPGSRNWGYDGVYPFAVQNSYGGPQGLKLLVNACHRKGLAVVLDVVYNHLGPEGNYLADFGPYFTDRYQTPWGRAINFDGPDSDEVRCFFIENALYWIEEFHIDALRLDALHAILDISPYPFLQELAACVHEEAERHNRRAYLIAESDLNDARLLRSPEVGGYGLDAQWNDDFHHCLHTLLTNEQTGYYRDFGQLSQLVKAFREGFVYSGDYSLYRRRRHGIPSRDIPAPRFVVFVQNHDQVGNRMQGDRLSQLVDFEGLKLAAAVVLLSPFVPLLFMGEEYGETAPFQYFVNHSEPALIEAVRRGRREEFSAFRWQSEPPDPQDEATFQRAKLNHQLRQEENHRVLREFYRELIRLRKEIPALSPLSKDALEAVGYEQDKVLFLRRWTEDEEALMMCNFGDCEASVPLNIPAGSWQKQLDTADGRWNGPGNLLPSQLNSNAKATVALGSKTFALFTRIKET